MQVQSEVLAKLTEASEFVGYDTLEAETTVAAIIVGRPSSKSGF